MTTRNKETAETQYQQRVEGVGDFTVSKSGDGKYLLSGIVVKPVSFEGTAKETAAAIYQLSRYMWFPNEHPESDHDIRSLDSMCGFQTSVGQTFPEIEKELTILDENA